jgi:hypothetical protein
MQQQVEVSSTELFRVAGLCSMWLEAKTLIAIVLYLLCFFSSAKVGFHRALITCFGS